MRTDTLNNKSSSQSFQITDRFNGYSVKKSLQILFRNFAVPGAFTYGVARDWITCNLSTNLITN